MEPPFHSSIAPLFQPTPVAEIPKLSFMTAQDQAKVVQSFIDNAANGKSFHGIFSKWV